MKRAALLFSGIVGATLILATACGGAAPAETPTEPPAETATVAPTEPAATTAPAESPAAETPAETPPAGGDGGDLAAQGETVAQNAGCFACHSTDGSTLVGPTWQGLYGSEVTLADGSTVTVDDEYIRESIVDPNAKVVEGFSEGLMPQNFGETLSDSDIEAIIAYIESLQ